VVRPSRAAPLDAPPTVTALPVIVWPLDAAPVDAAPVRGVADRRLDSALTQVDRRPQPPNTLSARNAVRSAARAIALGQRVRIQNQTSQAFDDLLEL